MADIVNMTERDLPDTCFVFKHSTRCPVSTAAATQVRNAQLRLPLYWINVVEQRDLSNWVAEHYAVAHESPQFLFIENGVVQHVLNHSRIEQGAVEAF